jgi:arginine decarboxylase
MQEPWDIPAAISLYNTDRWGLGYFSINSKGNIEVRPTQDSKTPIDMMEVIEEARKEYGLGFPMVLRFQDLLRHRVETINRAFGSAMEEFGYKAPYRGVFPIKVNQLREVVEEIMDAGRPYHFGIEAGSKPELLAALAIHRDPESLIICNGYKDAQFVQNALLGRKLGKQVILVVEKLEELHQILAVSKEVGVEPMIGVRVRLAAKGAGKWALSGGENAKFGLSRRSRCRQQHPQTGRLGARSEVGSLPRRQPGP